MEENIITRDIIISSNDDGTQTTNITIMLDEAGNITADCIRQMDPADVVAVFAVLRREMEENVKANVLTQANIKPIKLNLFGRCTQAVAKYLQKDDVHTVSLQATKGQRRTESELSETMRDIIGTMRKMYEDAGTINETSLQIGRILEVIYALPNEVKTPILRKVTG